MSAMCHSSEMKEVVVPSGIRIRAWISERSAIGGNEIVKLTTFFII